MSTPPPSGKRWLAHYRELLKVVRKRPYDADVLQEDAAQLILLAERARKALASGATSQLPGPVLREPTLWRLFEAEAQQGSLAPGSGDPSDPPAFKPSLILTQIATSPRHCIFTDFQGALH